MSEIVDDKVSTWTIGVKCSDCKSTLKIVAADVETVRLGSFDEFETFFVVECPACKSDIKVGSKIPNWVKARARPRAA